MSRTWMSLKLVANVAIVSGLVACQTQRQQSPVLFYAQDDAASPATGVGVDDGSRRLARPLFFDKRSLKSEPAPSEPLPTELAAAEEPLVTLVAEAVEEPVAVLALSEVDEPPIATEVEDIPELAEPLDVAADRAISREDVEDASDTPGAPEVAELSPARDASVPTDEPVAVVVDVAPPAALPVDPVEQAEPQRPHKPTLRKLTPAGTVIGQLIPSERRDTLRALELTAATDLSNSKRRMDLARHLFFDGEAGDANAAHRARGLLESLGKARSDDPIVLAYLGAASIRHASKATSAWNRSELTRRALSQLDAAVERSDFNLEVLYLRAMVTIDLPDMFGRHDQAVADLAYLVEHARPALEAGTLERSLVASAYYRYAQALRDDGDESGARSALRDLIRLTPDTPAATAAADYLHAVHIASSR